jgi:hypothetical protein
MTYNIIWQGTAKPELEQLIRDDLADVYKTIGEVDCPKGLVFHHYAVSPDGYDGPVVFCYWDEEADALSCQYLAVVEVVKTDDIQIDVDELRDDDGELPDWLKLIMADSEE